MCGIAAAIKFNIKSKSFDHKIKDWCKDVFNVLSVRGRDGAGLAAVASNGDTIVQKDSIPTHVALQTREFENLLKADWQAMLMHARKTTLGGNWPKCAQPFQEEKRVLIHNGTVHDVFKQYPMAYTDSEAMLMSINEKGIKKTLESSSGAWAIITVDGKKNKLQVVRNADRPLYYATVKLDDWLLIASEPWMITGMAARNKIDLDKDGDGYSVYEFSPSHVYHWDLTNDSLHKPKKVAYSKKQYGAVIHGGTSTNKVSATATNLGSGSTQHISQKESKEWLSANYVLNHDIFKSNEPIRLNFEVRDITKMFVYQGYESTVLRGALANKFGIARTVYCTVVPGTNDYDFFSQHLDEHGAGLHHLVAVGTVEKVDPIGGVIYMHSAAPGDFKLYYEYAESVMHEGQLWFGGCLWKYDELQQFLAPGCGQCDSNVDIEQLDFLGVTSDNFDVVCPDCMHSNKQIKLFDPNDVEAYQL
jgi:predicted glutamine amidotransferase